MSSVATEDLLRRNGRHVSCCMSFDTAHDASVVAAEDVSLVATVYMPSAATEDVSSIAMEDM